MTAAQLSYLNSKLHKDNSCRSLFYISIHKSCRAFQHRHDLPQFSSLSSSLLFKYFLFRTLNCGGRMSGVDNGSKQLVH